MALVSGGTPSPSIVVPPSSYSSARGTDSTTEDVENQVKDCNDDLVKAMNGMNREFGNVTYGYYGANYRHNYGRDSGDDGVDNTTDGGNNGTLRERHWLSAADYGISWQMILTIIAVAVVVEKEVWDGGEM